MAHTELDLRERRTIKDMLTAKLPVREIAAKSGRHPPSLRQASLDDIQRGDEKSFDSPMTSVS